jgi:hypothetical protein
VCGYPSRLARARTSDAENVSASGLEFSIRFSNSLAFVIPGCASWREPGMHNPCACIQHQTSPPRVWIPDNRCAVSGNDGVKMQLRDLAAQCVRALPVPREPREAMERWEAPGCLRGTLGGGIKRPTSRGKAPRAPKARRSASQRSTGQSIDRSGAPRSGQLSLCPLKGSLLESVPHWTGREQDKRGLDHGDRYTFTSS